MDNFPEPVRIDGSYFYFAQNQPCQGDRLAVISSPDVHNFIVGFIATKEKIYHEHRFVIGLNYNADHDKFSWDNGE